MMKTYIALYLSSIFIFCACKRKPPGKPKIDAPYKHWIIYNLDVKTFQDSDNDGEGDFQGLTSRLDYLRELGVNTIWLAPFQPSPLEDDGYDVIDYYAIDPKLGSKADFQKFLSTAKSMGLHVIMDLALNHSSIWHPWFRAKPNWYVWAKVRPSDWNKGMGFPGVEQDSWHKDSLSGNYYFHRFYRFEPDLNYQNPEVAEEAEHIIGYWLDQGLDGFRLDAVPFMIDDPRQNAEKPRFDFNLLHRLTRFVIRHKPGAVLLGEANVDPDENRQYFAGHHDGLQMMFNFYANQYLFYGLATGDARSFKKGLQETKEIPGIAQWAWFLRNHDEIDLGRLNHHQFKQVTGKMGADTNMQLYKRGIRRRLAPMLSDDTRKLQLAYALLYGLPGSPVIRQGEEIGMGDDLELKERLSVRTPMQWDSTANGGFTRGHPFRPVINSEVYGFRQINVQKENADPQSLLNFVRHMITLRKKYREIDNGEWHLQNSGKEVLSISYSDNGKIDLLSYNFSDKPQKYKLGEIKINLPAYGFDWRRL
jgi:maltose alpha-D-glucosyltransferase/alpha-amylase